jgi:peptidyl-prolyl cis-trans isomerase D
VARQDPNIAGPLGAVFSTPAGKARMRPAPNGAGWFIVRTEQATRGDVANAPGIVEATRAQLTQSIGQEFVAQFIRAIERGVEVERNAASIAKLKADLARSVAP